MRKLLVVFIIFLTSLIALILLFNTFVNSSKQSNIKLVQGLPTYPKAAEHLGQAIQIATTQDSLSPLHFKQFHRWIQEQYAPLFDNPNVVWQTFEEHSLVCKWIGRTPELPPIVLVANQEVEEPALETIPEWSFNPFMGHIDETHIYGAGTRQGKAVIIALLEVLNKFVTDKVLPNRTIYFAFPHNEEEGELAIINALKQAQINPELILKTGGLIAQNMLWDIAQPTALIGVGHNALTQAVLETNQAKSNQIIAQEVEQLRTALPAMDVNQEGLKAFLSYLSPELGFGQRAVFSNQWLLNNIQQKRLQNNPLTQHYFGHNIEWTTALPDSNNRTLTTLTFSAPTPLPNMEQWIKTHVQHPQIQLLGEPQILHNNNKIAPTDNRSFRLISNTCKEVFPNLITAPILVHETSSLNWQSMLSADIYYFHPIQYNMTNWTKAQRKVDEKISLQNYKQLLQFYYQILKNHI